MELRIEEVTVRNLEKDERALITILRIAFTREIDTAIAMENPIVKK
jgi:hypothetical protein